MDSWRNHLLFGIFFETLFIVGMFIWKRWYFVLELNFILIGTAIFFISPLLLDLDHKMGKLRETLTLIGLGMGVIGIIGGYFYTPLNILKDIGIILASTAYMLFYITHHRGFVHSIPTCLIFCGIILLLTNNYQLASLGLIGVYTHLVADKIPFKLW